MVLPVIAQRPDDVRLLELTQHAQDIGVLAWRATVSACRAAGSATGTQVTCLPLGLEDCIAARGQPVIRFVPRRLARRERSKLRQCAAPTHVMVSPPFAR
jgi:hypothetical protein